MKTLREFLKENINVINEMVEKDLGKNRAVKMIDLNNKMEFTKDAINQWEINFKMGYEIGPFDFSDKILKKELGFIPKDLDDRREEIEVFIEKKEKEVKDYIKSLREEVKKMKKELNQMISKYDFNTVNAHLDFFVALFAEEKNNERKYFERYGGVSVKVYESIVNEIIEEIDNFEEMEVDELYDYIEMATYSSRDVIQNLKENVEESMEDIQKSARDNSRKFSITRPINPGYKSFVEELLDPESIFGIK